MANPKGRTKSFDDFRGVDLFSSHLSRGPNFATDFQNYVVTSRKSARGRVGHKITSQRYFPITTDSRLYNYPRGGLVDYSYPNGAGSTTQELIGLGQGAHRYAKREGIFRIALPANSSFHFLPMDTGGTYHMVADCRINGITVGGVFPLDCGFGTETTATMITLEALRDAINALGGGWSVTLTPNAKINGAQAARSHIVSITVDNPHTLSQGNRVECEVVVGASVYRRWFDVIETAAAAITLKDATDPAGTWDVPDNGGIGIGMYSACLLPFTELSRAISGAAASISFGYWQGMQTHATVASLVTQAVGAVGYGRQITARECSNVLYYGTDQIVHTDANNGSIRSGVIKYDGRECYAAGMPQFPIPTLGALGAGLLGIGRYKYIAEYVYTDARGNEVHGNASDLLGEAIITNGAAASVGVTLAQLTSMVFNHHTAQIDTAGAPVGPTTIIPVVPATCRLRQGDFIYIYDSAGVLHYRQVTQLRYDTTYPALNSVEVHITGAAITVIDTAPYDIISNVIIRVWRTRVGGSFYYRLWDFLNDPNSATVVYVDNIADTALGEEWGGPYTGRDRRDMPPRARLLEPHQALLAGAGDPDYPETIFWSNYESAEYWSRSSNYQDILSTRAGVITALASDQLDTLIVFKAKSFSVLSGDLYEGAFSLTSEVKGDVGCPSANGWQKIREAIIFFSQKGPRSIVSGQIAGFDDRLTSFFNRDAKLYIEELNGARSLLYPADCSGSLHDEAQMKLYFDVPFVPDASGSWIYRRFVFDYQKNLWSVFTLPSDFFAIGGMGVFDGSYFMLGGAAGGTDTPTVLGVSLNLDQPYAWSQLQSTGITWVKYAYIDGTRAIPRVFRPQWEFIDDPSTDKEFHTIKVWSLDPSPFVSHTLNVKTYRNFDYATIDSEANIAFTAESTIDGKVPLVLNRAKALQMSFENKTLFECPHITGYELQIVMPYDKEELEGNLE